MLDLEALNQIDRQALRQNAWRKEMNAFPTFRGTAHDWLCRPRDGAPESEHLKALREQSDELREMLGGINPKYLQELDLSPGDVPTHDEIRKSYRRLSRQFHPDFNVGNAEALAKFKRVNTAYDKVEKFSERIDGIVADTEKKLKAHFALHGQSKGWKEGLSGTSRPAASFPIDHLPTEQKEELLKTLRAAGYQTEEHFASSIGGKVVSVVGGVHDRPKCMAIVEELRNRFRAGMAEATELQPVKNALIRIGTTSESQSADVLKRAVETGENTASKSGGATKWIIGGILAATVMVGAFIVYKRKNAAEIKKERQQHIGAAHSVS